MVLQERRDGETIDSLLKKFKRGVKREGILPRLREKEFFEKPSDKKKRDKKAASRRNKIQQKADEL
ncbi:MAG: 30S ribosomal protein S21 [Actinobacteria bacterium]|nr:30S ribosomal protein S21 [Actinomycetota bacterium]|tara:strand:+ start:21441 stop:21638 length:198 start_codon:yes stop_codon:yes gene_type:complete